MVLVGAGRPIGCPDAWVAAVALYGVPLVTHNKSDYLGVANLVRNLGLT